MWRRNNANVCIRARRGVAHWKRWLVSDKDYEYEDVSMRQTILADSTHLARIVGEMREWWVMRRKDNILYSQRIESVAC